MGVLATTLLSVSLLLPTLAAPNVVEQPNSSVVTLEDLVMMPTNSNLKTDDEPLSPMAWIHV